MTFHKIMALLTSPGIVMHEISHRLMCDLFKVPVYEVKYFEVWSSKLGFVRHEKTNNITHDFWIGISPLVINSILCMVLTFPCVSSMYLTGVADAYSMILCWMGGAMGINSIPSDQDIASITEYRTSSNMVLVLCDVIRCINAVGNRYFTGALYTYLLATALPRLIFHSYSYL